MNKLYTIIKISVPGRYLFLIMMLLGLSVAYAQQPTWLTAVSNGGTGDDQLTNSYIDAQGNNYHTGYFTGTVTIGGTSYSATSGGVDIYVAKFDKDGNKLWVSTAGGTGTDVARGIGADANGNVYVCGYHSSASITFNGITVNNAGGRDAFVMKFNADGSKNWIKNYGTASNEEAAAIAVSTNGDFYITGEFASGGIVLDAVSLTTYGGKDIFVAKVNSSGVVQWAKKGGGTGDDTPNDLKLNKTEGILYCLSSVAGDATFGTRTTTGSANDICLIRYSASSGTESWASRAGGTGIDKGIALAINSVNSANVTGYFTGTATFGTVGSVTAVGSNDVFVAQYNSSGTPIWVKKAGSTTDDAGNGIAVDLYNNIYVTGSYSSSITFGSLSALSNSGGTDIFIAKYSDAGNELLAAKAGGTGNDVGISIGLDNYSRMYLGGNYQSSVTFGTISRTSQGLNDFYIGSLFDGYTWVGTTNTSWTTTTNWKPAAVPAATDNVVIYSSANNPVLSANTTVANFTIAGGTLNLNAKTLTISGLSTFSTGTITGGSITSNGSAVTYSGTTFDAIVTANCADILLNGSIFNNTTSITKTGTVSNYSTGGNTFNGTTTITNTGTGEFGLANGGIVGDVFNASVTFARTGTGALSPAMRQNNTFKGNVTCNGSSIIFNNYPTAGTCIFDGSLDQVIGGTSSGISISKFRINKTLTNITVNVPITIAETLVFETNAKCKINNAANIISFSATATIQGAGEFNFITGKVRRDGIHLVSSFTFPVGAGNVYMPVTLKASYGLQPSGTFDVQAYNSVPPNGTSFQDPVIYINPFYWDVTQVAGTSNMILEFPWNSYTPGVINPADEIVAHSSSGKWYYEGSNNLNYSGAIGSVSSNVLTSYGLFTLGYRKGNPDPCITCDPTLNWIAVRDYDEYGRVINEQRVYADKLGRVTQSQQRNLEEDKILAKALLYDYYGRPVLSTLPAPISSSNFDYEESFIAGTMLCGNPGSQYNCPYRYTDFDGASTLNNPNVVAPESPLGKYYSINSDEAYIATSSYPYSRVHYNSSIVGGVVRSSEPGNAMRMGAGHETRGVVLPVYDELADYMIFKNKYFVNAGTSLDGEVLKTVIKDENGTESITYSDKSGKTIVSCLAGTASLPITTNIKAKFFTSTLTVPASVIYSSFIVESPDVVDVVYNAGGGTYTYTGLASGIPWKELVEVSTFTISSNKPFSITYNSVSITGNGTFSKVKVYSQESNYLNNSVDIHLQNNHNLSLSQSISGNSVRINNLETGSTVYNGTVAGFSSSGIQPGFYRITYTTQNTVTNSNTSAYITVSYNARYGNHAYYYYDNAGRLIGQTAPLGVAAGSTGANSSYTSKYTYNSLNWLLSSQDADRGLTYYVYQKDGRLRFYQDLLQRNNNRFAYINYDNVQRPVETGEYTSSASPNNLYFQNMLDNYNGVAIPGGYVNIFTSLNAGTAVTGTMNLATVSKQNYDVAFDLTSVKAGYMQRNVNGRVSRTYNDNSIYWYSYDERGRLEWTVQQLTGTEGTIFSSTAADRVKTNNYGYNFRGNLLTVFFQKDVTAERLDHFYSYDVMQRLRKVETKSGNDALTENAEYKYYLHGPLKRKEIGNDLQGMDYVYTISGMLKAINHPNLDGNDPGRDNFSPIAGQEDHSSFYKDVFGMVLEYYDNDYVNGTKYQTTSNLTSAGYQEYFNGVIRSWTWNTREPVNNPNPNPVQYAYKYDAKYQMTAALFGDHNKTTNAFDAGTGKYNVTDITYDLNGNLITLSRKDQSGVVQTKDNINYVLNSGKNSLSITHSGTPGSPTRTYGYDAIGQMTSSTNTIGEKNKYISYDYTGKVTAVYNSTGTSQPLVSYLYDEKGHKIRKTSYHATTYAITEYTWYINDVAGNVLSVYKTSAGVTSQKEAFVYGTERIGIVNKNGATEYNYELKDHLGNVRAVIRKFNGNLDVLDAADYYPHGGRMAGRGNISGNGYRFGYQGEWAERNTELMDEVVDFDLRMYDPTLGRFLSPDPYYQYHSPYMAMHNNPISTIDPDGGNGMGPTGGSSTGGNAGPTGGFGSAGGGGAGAGGGGGLFQQIGNFLSNLFGGNNGCDHDQKSYQHGGSRSQQQAYQQSRSQGSSNSGTNGGGTNSGISSIPSGSGNGGGTQTVNQTGGSSGYSGGNQSSGTVGGNTGSSGSGYLASSDGSSTGSGVNINSGGYTTPCPGEIPGMGFDDSEPGYTHETNKGKDVWTSDGRLGIPRNDEQENQYLKDNGLYGLVVRVCDASLRYNCAGYVFTGGRRWMGTGGEMEKIISDNYGDPVLIPKPGDIVIYRREGGYMEHVGIVIEADGLNGPTIISKWGDHGLYIHYVFDVPSGYPNRVEFYRPNNGSNILIPKK